MSVSSVSALRPTSLAALSPAASTGQSNTAADAQNRVNALNQLIVNVSHLGWGGIAAKDGAAAVPIAQQELAQSIQLFESSEIGMASKEGLTGINFDYDKVSFSSQDAGNSASSSGSSTQLLGTVENSGNLALGAGRVSASGGAGIALSLLADSNTGSFDTTSSSAKGRARDFYA